MSGIPCPLCGGTTAIRNLLHGDLSAAWATHPLVVVGVVLALIHSVMILIEVVRRKSFESSGWWRPWAWWGGATVLWWIGKLVTSSV